MSNFESDMSSRLVYEKNLKILHWPFIWDIPSRQEDFGDEVINYIYYTC